jgi:hypothetical protein
MAKSESERSKAKRQARLDGGYRPFSDWVPAERFDEMKREFRRIEAEFEAEKGE